MATAGVQSTSGSVHLKIRNEYNNGFLVAVVLLVVVVVVVVVVVAVVEIW
jgi:t-SNARE complex subunit (syntaxin)